MDHIPVMKCTEKIKMKSLFLTQKQLKGIPLLYEPIQSALDLHIFQTEVAVWSVIWLSRPYLGDAT